MIFCVTGWGFPFGAATAKSRSGECRFCSFDRFSLLQIVIIYVNIKAVR